MGKSKQISYLLKRLGMAVFVLILISIIIFVTVRLSPGDPVMNKIGPYGDTSQENYDRVKAELGLDKSYVTQYLIWLSDCVQLDFGYSLRNGMPISQQIFQKLPVSFELIIAALLIALVIAVPLGMLAAVKRGSIADQIIRLLSTSFLAMPAFCIGLMMIVVFSVILKQLPPGGYTDFFTDPAMNVRQLIMPAVTLGLFEAAVICRHVRANTLDVLSANYMRTAKAKGLPPVKVYGKHALKNILIPLTTVTGTEFASLFGGTVICEQVFGWSGLGWYLYQSISNRDYPAVQASVLVVATIFVVVNLLMDLIYTLVDPRVKLR